METFKIKNLKFAYPGQSVQALEGVELTVNKGEFLVICGPSGSGKTTLLRLLKPAIAPHGDMSGEILIDGLPLDHAEPRDVAQKIGFVSQSPDSQIVTDKVWRELAFGLENLGCDSGVISRRVAEMASFFGIQPWYEKSVDELSGGQKQLLNLASVMAMQPRVLILDEPTSQLDPIAASHFLSVVGKVNRELGVTVILTDHRLEEAFSFATSVAVMNKGKLVCRGTPAQVGKQLKAQNSALFLAMPSAMRVWASVDSDYPCPVSVRDASAFLGKLQLTREFLPVPEQKTRALSQEAVLKAKDVRFRYEKQSPDVIKGLDLVLRKGEFFALLGGNGSGKTTALKVLSGIKKHYAGKVVCEKKIGVLPQNVQTLFVAKTLREDLEEVAKKTTEKFDSIVNLCRLNGLLDRHPYDLSGGEQQRAALAKILLCEPEILMLDEPTKGLDAAFKQVLAEMIGELTCDGVTVLAVSHDIEFCAQYADRCALLFNGSIAAVGTPRQFFTSNSFYTTAANRMARVYLPDAVVTDDIIAAIGGRVEPVVSNHEPKPAGQNKQEPAESKRRNTDGNRLSKRTGIALLSVIVLIPMTLLIGAKYFDNRSYNVIALAVLLECMAPFFLLFEGRKPKARELVIIAVLCALGVAGRAAFFMLPQFKPVMAITIIAGVALGGETGFLVGAVTMLVSNMLFSQGPWTPWQMFCMGMTGFLAGLLFHTGLLRPNRFLLSVYGALAAIVIYGGIINAASAVMWGGTQMSINVLLAYWVSGFPLDCIHAAATVIFLLITAKPMLEKLERIKIKYAFMK